MTLAIKGVRATVRYAMSGPSHRGLVAVMLAVAIGLAILLFRTLNVPAQVIMFGLFHPENSESGITLVANQDNLVTCVGNGNFPLMDSSYAQDPNVALMIYEYTGHEPSVKGQYYLSTAQRFLTPDASPATLTVFQRGKIYDIHPTQTLIFRCGAGIGRVPQSSSSSASSVSSAQSSSTCATHCDAQAGCSFPNITRNSNGCVLSCGPMVCASSSSRASTSSQSPTADLQISEFAALQVPSPTTVYANSNVLFGITVGNNGPSTSTSVLSIPLPATWSLRAADSTPGGVIQNGIFYLHDLQPRGSGQGVTEWANFNTGNMQCGSTVSVQATVSPTGGASDPDLSNNQSSIVTLTVLCLSSSSSRSSLSSSSSSSTRSEDICQMQPWRCSSSSSSSSINGTPTACDSLETKPATFPANNYGVLVTIHNPETGVTYMFNKTRQMYVYENGSVSARIYDSNVSGWVEADAGVAATGTNALYLLGRGGAIYRYDIGANTMQLATVASETRYGGYLAGARAVWSPVDRKIYFFGGYSNGSFLNTILTFDVASGTTSLSNAFLPLPLSASAAIWDAGRNKILVIGGYEGNSTGTGGWSTAVYEFDPSLSTLMRVASLPTALSHPSAVYDPFLQKVYIFSAGNNLVRFNPQNHTFITSTAVLPNENGYGFPVWDTTTNKTLLFNAIRNIVREYNACPQ